MAILKTIPEESVTHRVNLVTLNLEEKAAYVKVDIGGNGVYLKRKILEIGDWNMDSLSPVYVAHGLSISNIRRVTILIRDDANTSYYNFESYGSFFIGVTNISLNRTFSSIFDSTSFDSTSYNRGWVIIEYV